MKSRTTSVFGTLRAEARPNTDPLSLCRRRARRQRALHLGLPPPASRLVRRSPRYAQSRQDELLSRRLLLRLPLPADAKRLLDPASASPVSAAAAEEPAPQAPRELLLIAGSIRGTQVELAPVKRFEGRPGGTRRPGLPAPAGNHIGRGRVPLRHGRTRSRQRNATVQSVGSSPGSVRRLQIFQRKQMIYERVAVPGRPSRRSRLGRRPRHRLSSCSSRTGKPAPAGMQAPTRISRWFMWAHDAPC